MTKKGDEKFAKCWIHDNAFVKDDVKVRNHCHVTGKYRGARIEIVISTSV